MGVDAEMAVRTPLPLSADQVLDLAWRLAGAFGDERFFFGEGRHCLSIIEGDPEEEFFAVPGEGQLLRVHLWGRYYGHDYERGDAPLLCAVAEWLEVNIAGASVYYGGDCDIGLHPFGATERAALLLHFYRHGHLPYEGYFGGRRDGPRPECSLCHKPLLNCGGGQGESFFSCYGCPEKAITRRSDGEVLARWRGREDFFEMAQRVRDAAAKADA